MDSDNDLAPIRRQAIIWASDGLVYDAYIRHSISMSIQMENIRYKFDHQDPMLILTLKTSEIGLITNTSYSFITNIFVTEVISY